MKTLFSTLALLLVATSGARAEVILDNCEARWGENREMVETCAIDQIIARDELDKLWSKVGSRVEALGVWIRCKDRWPGVVAGHDWVLVNICVNEDLGPARAERREYQRNYRQDLIHSSGGVWQRYGPRAYGPDGQVCDYDGDSWLCR